MSDLFCDEIYSHINRFPEDHMYKSSTNDLQFHALHLTICGGAVASWLVRSTRDRAVRVILSAEPWPGTLCCVRGQDT